MRCPGLQANQQHRVEFVDPRLDLSGSPLRIGLTVIVIEASAFSFVSNLSSLPGALGSLILDGLKVSAALLSLLLTLALALGIGPGPEQTR